MQDLANVPATLVVKSKPRRSSKSADMRQRFVEVTTQLVRKNGLADVSTRDICEAVGVKAPSLYHHFGDVATLHNAVIEHAFANYYAFWKDRSNIDDPYQRVRDGWDTYISFSQSEPELFAIVAQQNFTSDLPAPIVEAHLDLIEDLKIIHAIRALRYEPALSAQIFTAACIGVASMLAAQRHGIPTAPELSAITREAVLGSLML
jgi:AcrR family transcriptional regulator